MENRTPMVPSPELQKAIIEGYIHTFEFADGNLLCHLYPANVYPISTCNIVPYPCLDARIIIYKIRTPDNIKGIAILTMNQDHESFYY